MEKKKFILIGLLLILLSLAAGGIFYFTDYLLNKKITFKSDLQKNIKEKIGVDMREGSMVSADSNIDEFSREMDNFLKAVEQKNFEYCDGLSIKNECISTVAAAGGNLDQCFNLDSKEDRGECLVGAIAWNGDHAICEKAEDGIKRNQCYKAAFERQPDEAICRMVAGASVPFTRANCYFNLAVSRNDQGLCGLSGEYRDRCYYLISVNSKDISSLGNIEDEVMRNYSYYINSLQSSDVRPCRLIGDNDTRTLCRSVAGLDPAGCRNIEGGKFKSYCLNTVALRTGQAEYCVGSSKCVTEIAVKNNNLEACEIFKKRFDDAGYYDCVTELSLANRDKEACGLLPVGKKIRCYTAVAVRTGDIDICRDMLTEAEEAGYRIYRDMCIGDVAESLGEPDICNELDGDQSICRQFANQEKIAMNKDTELCGAYPAGSYDRSDCAYHTAVNTDTYELCEMILEHQPNNPLVQEEYHECYENYFNSIRKELLMNIFVQEKNAETDQQNNEVANIKVTVESGEGITHLAEKALKQYLESLTDTEKELIGWPLLLGQRIFIEDYLKNRYFKNRILKAGETIVFEKEIIVNAIEESGKLTEKQLENLSKYTFGRTELSFYELENPELSICDFKFYLRPYSGMDERDKFKFSCMIELSSDYGLCEQMIESEYDMTCADLAVKQSDDHGICWDFQNERSRNACFSGFAEKKQDPGLCEYCQDISRAICYDALAEDLADPGICALINREDIKTRCEDRFVQERGECDKIKYVETRNRCYRELAVKTRDPLVCEKCSSESNRPEYIKHARSLCYLDLGKVNIEACQLLDDDILRVSCYRGFSDNNIFSKNECEKASSALIRDICILQSPNLEKNMCAEIENIDVRDICRKKFAASIEDCRRLAIGTEKNNCLYHLALDAKNEVACVLINDVYEINRCLNNLVNLSKNKSYCDLMDPGHYMRNSCGHSYIGSESERMEKIVNYHQ